MCFPGRSVKEANTPIWLPLRSGPFSRTFWHVPPKKKQIQAANEGHSVCPSRVKQLIGGVHCKGTPRWEVRTSWTLSNINSEPPLDGGQSETSKNARRFAGVTINALGTTICLKAKSIDFNRDPYIIHLNIATCKWWFPFIQRWKKPHVSNGQHVSFKEPCSTPFSWDRASSLLKPTWN